MILNDFPKIKEFISKNIQFEDILDLPNSYPNKDKFDEFQYGYRYNPIEKQNLTGTNDGDWNGNWFVICSNYYNDPFLIDISEKELNFPVYFTSHGAGKWIIEKVANSINEFEDLLSKVKPIEDNYSKAIDFFKNQKPTKLWNQIIEELAEMQEYEDDED